MKKIYQLTKIYNKGFCGLDIINIMNSNILDNPDDKLKLRIYFNKIKQEFRMKIFIFNILFFIIIRSDYHLEKYPNYINYIKYKMDDFNVANLYESKNEWLHVL